ncbi:MAG TPA: hypothetical protein VJT73_17365, partial [Polyangiaceae bacterium]|nr:hypothetical protein [Polyangiaceae bacterium]
LTERRASGEFTNTEIIAELRHPHLVAMRAAAEGPGFEPRSSTERTFAELKSAATNPVSLGLALRILLDTLSGLAAIHNARFAGEPIHFVHGEVSPTYIVVGRDGLARLTPVTHSRWAPGSLPPREVAWYQAPEKLLGDTADQRADVFSAGVLLWEALEGRPLFYGLAADEIVTQLVGGKVRAPAVPTDSPWARDLAEVAMRALEVDPELRWPHVGAFGAEIENVAQGHLGSPDELAAWVRASGVRMGDSFTDEATTQRRAIPGAAPVSGNAPSSLAAVSARIGHDGPASERPSSSGPALQIQPAPAVPREAVLLPPKNLQPSWGNASRSRAGKARLRAVSAALASGLMWGGIVMYKLVADRAPSTPPSTVLASDLKVAPATPSPSAPPPPIREVPSRALPALEATPAAMTSAAPTASVQPDKRIPVPPARKPKSSVAERFGI